MLFGPSEDPVPGGGGVQCLLMGKGNAEEERTESRLPTVQPTGIGLPGWKQLEEPEVFLHPTKQQ